MKTKYLKTICISIEVASYIGLLICTIISLYYLLKYNILLASTTTFFLSIIIIGRILSCFDSYILCINDKRYCDIIMSVIFWLVEAIIIALAILDIIGIDGSDGFNQYNADFNFSEGDEIATYVRSFEESFNCNFSYEFNESSCQEIFESYFQGKVLGFYIPMFIFDFILIISYLIFIFYISTLKEEVSSDEIRMRKMKKRKSYSISNSNYKSPTEEHNRSQLVMILVKLDENDN